MSGLLKTLTNSLLAALPAADLDQIKGQLATIDLEKGKLLYDPGDPVDTIYFPHDGVISLMTLMENGAAIETATVGREGAVGLQAAVAPRQALNRAIVQVPGRATRAPASTIADLWRRSDAVRLLVDRHGDALYAHAAQSVACNALHSVEARFCRWLLSCHDRIAHDTISLTQEFLADMLGVQRTTVTAVAGALQNKGLIRYRRGIVDILDRDGLEAMTCECYGVVRHTYERLLPGSFDKGV